MQGMILAAGMGKRLKYLTKNNTKCMVKVNGISLIERMLRIMDKKQLSRIVIVVGYKGKQLIEYIDTLNIKTPICYINNPIYNKTNNIYSLALAKEYLCTEDTILAESDLIFEEKIIDDLINDSRKNLAVVDKFESWMDGACMELDENDIIKDFIPGKFLNFSAKGNYYKTLNIYKFSKEFCKNTYIPFLTAYEKTMGENEYYESVIKLIAMLETKEIQAKRISGETWYEIDNIQDLNIAESLFTNSEEEFYTNIASRYGGYWRYPKLLDFCYLVNPYYPSERMMEEMKSNFETLLTQYPSGMKINSIDASEAFGIEEKNIVIGNGAAELIKVVIEKFLEDKESKLGCVCPTFEEYKNRFDKKRIVEFNPQNENFSYTVEDIIGFFDNRAIDLLILINPDNPSGNYIEKENIIKLIEWAKEKAISLIIDESFVDFVDCKSTKKLGNLSCINEETLNMYEKLYVIKSISKSYGVPGIRLGVLASKDEKMIEYIKRSVPIWNINSFGEFFVQITGKYEKDYAKSLAKIKKSRVKLYKELDKIEYLRVIPSQANYLMCEVIGKTSKEICIALLKKDVFIKDLTQKIGDGKQYIRIAVRNEADNKKLLNILRDLF
ncbi:Histidinol-phosphate/aromatic aminotransferase or cobyric acid decarboxylase [Lachnospiraceae bacterium C7]|nr:Histidinol-phosphate/aromatic aminotransferase or cobyric acid decarboxylase [Lachnospiraceae bacterium C7]